MPFYNKEYSYGLTEIAGGMLTKGSWKNLLASARPKRLLCMPVKEYRISSTPNHKHPERINSIIDVKDKPVSYDSVLCRAFTSGKSRKARPVSEYPAMNADR